MTDELLHDEDPLSSEIEGMEGLGDLLRAGEDVTDDVSLNETREQNSTGSTSGTEAMPFTPLSISETREEGKNSSLLMDLTLPLSVELGRTTMLIKDLMALSPGAVIELDKLVGEPVDLIVNDKKLAEGEVVVIEENFAVRVTAIADSNTGRAKRNRIGR